jgi:hypothetical protein
MPVTVSRSDGVLECWSIARELYASKNLVGFYLKLKKIDVEISLFQYSITLYEPQDLRVGGQHSIGMLSLTEKWKAPFQGQTKVRSFGPGFFTIFHLFL